MDEQTVRDAIYALIERNDKRVKDVQAELKMILPQQQRILHEVLLDNLFFSSATLIELEHNLRLCGCPDEAYQQKEVQPQTK